MREEVKEGYEKADYEGDYRKDRQLQDKEKQLFQEVFDRMTEDAEVLDLGCGFGLPFDRYIVEKGFDVTGVDIAEKHVKQARDNVPEAEFIQGDFFEQDFGENSFEAIVSFYAIFHIPREEHKELFEKIRYWLKEDGVILVTMGLDEMDQHKGEIGGEEMVWSSYSQEENVRLVKEAGFNVLETYVEDWREETHQWILAEPE
jgi:cyclopropane fatty-acyl-phospholipid synthase-like methyltransferase